MQRFGLFLGHPNYAISVVLAALLFSSGLGSLWAAAIVSRLTSIRFVAYALSTIIFCEYFLILPGLTPLLDLPFATRALLVFVLIFPIGVCLGVFLPTAIEQMKQRSPGLVPWAWGVNGVFSVLSPILAVAVATTFGISALLLSSVPIYLVVAFSLPGPPESASPRPV
jgi:predicted RND superfamily exporter protein